MKLTWVSFKLKSLGKFNFFYKLNDGDGLSKSSYVHL